MSAVTKLLKFGLAHRQEIQGAYAKHGTDVRAHRNEAMGKGYDVACETGTKAATAPLRAAENIPRLVVRGLQFLFGIIMVGVYGVRVGDGSKHADEASATWVFGLFVGVAACLAAVVLAFIAPLGAISKRFKSHHLFSLDLFLSLLWFIVFGIFFAIFHNRSSDDSYKGSSTTVEKHITWLDLVSALLWLISGVYGAIKTWVGRKRDAVLLQGREKMHDRLVSRGNTAAENKEEMYDYSSVSEPEHVYQQGRPRSFHYQV